MMTDDERKTLEKRARLLSPYDAQLAAVYAALLEDEREDRAAQEELARIEQARDDGR